MKNLEEDWLVYDISYTSYNKYKYFVTCPRLPLHNFSFLYKLKQFLLSLYFHGVTSNSLQMSRFTNN